MKRALKHGEAQCKLQGLDYEEQYEMLVKYKTNLRSKLCKPNLRFREFRDNRGFFGSRLRARICLSIPVTRHSLLGLAVAGSAEEDVGQCETHCSFAQVEELDVYQPTRRTCWNMTSHLWWQKGYR